MIALKAPRIALYDQYGGLMPTGWTRFEFERFEFPYTVVYPQELDAGHLHDKFDVLILPDGAVSATLFVGGMNRSAFTNRQPAAEKVPEDVRPLLGLFSKEKTVPALDAFVKDGGEIITIGSSNRLSELLALPVRSALTEIGPDGKERELPGEKFYIPGSLIKAHVDSNNPVAYRDAGERGYVLRQEPGVSAVAGCGHQRRERDCMVWTWRPAGERMGVGAALPAGLIGCGTDS